MHRERIEKYGGRAAVSSLEDLLTVTLERQPGKHLGIRISGSCPEPGIFIVEILEDSITALDGRIKVLGLLSFLMDEIIKPFAGLRPAVIYQWDRCETLQDLPSL